MPRRDYSNPLVLQAWSDILRRLPSAVLLLVEFMFHSHAVPRLRDIFRINGVSGENRLLVMPKFPTAQHLNRSKLLDLHLDSRLQSGHTTTVDAIWAGTPVWLPLTIKFLFFKFGAVPWQPVFFFRPLAALAFLNTHGWVDYLGRFLYGRLVPWYRELLLA